MSITQLQKLRNALPSGKRNSSCLTFASVGFCKLTFTYGDKIYLSTFLKEMLFKTLHMCLVECILFSLLPDLLHLGYPIQDGAAIMSSLIAANPHPSIYFDHSLYLTLTLLTNLGRERWYIGQCPRQPPSPTHTHTLWDRDKIFELNLVATQSLRIPSYTL